MFAPRRSLPARILYPVPAYPRFGGRPVRRSRSGHPAAVVMALVGAIAVTAAALPFASAPVEARGLAQDATVVPPVRSEVRSTPKADRLVPAAAPVLSGTCDGVWGDEPLECLAQTA